MLNERTYAFCWGQATLSNVSGAFCAFIVGAVRSAAPTTASHPAGDIALAATSSLLNALSVLAAFCAFFVGAVLIATLATASHPAGDIALAAASSLLSALSVLAASCAFIVSAVRSAAPASASTLPATLQCAPPPSPQHPTPRTTSHRQQHPTYSMR